VASTSQSSSTGAVASEGGRARTGGIAGAEAVPSSRRRASTPRRGSGGGAVRRSAEGGGTSAVVSARRASSGGGAGGAAGGSTAVGVLDGVDAAITGAATAVAGRASTPVAIMPVGGPPTAPVRARRLGGGGNRRLHAPHATASAAFSALQNGQNRMRATRRLARRRSHHPPR
jgi:hypothetical protein